MLKHDAPFPDRNPASERFRDRREAGRRLATILGSYTHERDAVVVGIPRGGVVVAAAIAARLSLPLQMRLARKVGAPGKPELGIGAVAEGGAFVVDARVCESLRLPQERIDALVDAERAHLAMRVRALRGDEPRASLAGKVVILVDDGIATGSTIRAALHDVKRDGPKRVVIATPVGDAPTLEALEDEADEVVSLLRVDPLVGVGWWYGDFSQVTDEAVLSLVDKNG